MERLYNGILLPEEWPPRYPREILAEQMPAPYLDAPPEVICVDTGRQLFVDDFLIRETDLKRVCHAARKFQENPILKAETPQEREETIPGAAPKSGGVWWDRQERRFKMWYEAGWLNGMAYAESGDGIHWDRPDLGIVPGTNRILPCDRLRSAAAYWGKDYFRTDSTTVFLDYDDVPERKYKLFLRAPGGDMPGLAMTSPDGIHWEHITETTPLGDRSTMFYNPLRKKWVYSIRAGWQDRSRMYAEHCDYLKGASFAGRSVLWMCCDREDQPNDLIGFAPQLYNVDAVGYESVMLGMFQIMYGPENPVGQKTGCPKITELIPMFSRDGFHFTRPSRESVVSASLVKGSWDRGYIQSVGGICIVRRDELWIYYIGFSGGSPAGQDPDDWTRDAMYAGGATGIAKLRRDGFCSMEGCGTLTTRCIEFHGKSQLFANFTGALTAELLSPDGTVLARTRRAEGDDTRRMLSFETLDPVVWSGSPIRVRFTVDGALYAFWFAEDERGRSGGPLAAGAPDD